MSGPSRTRWRAAMLFATVLVTLAASAALAGCTPTPAVPRTAGSASVVPQPPSGHPATTGAMLAATAKAGVAEVTVTDAPGGREVSALASPTSVGAPLTFYVLEKKGGWLHVQLPQRPNGSTGWVSADQVVVTGLSYRVVVSTEQKRLWVYRNDRAVESYPVATGTGGTPTPHGDFYLTELLRPTNDGYGPYAFGLSAFSTVLDSFAGGPGQIGLHGTPDSSSIGHAASHGCVRLQNAAITRLARMLPLGTPVAIT